MMSPKRQLAQRHMADWPDLITLVPVAVRVT